MIVVGAVVVVGGVGTRSEGLVVKVAPRDLPDERPRPFGPGTRTVTSSVADRQPKCR